MSAKGAIVIVEPLSSGAAIAPVARERGFETIAIRRAGLHQSLVASFQPQDFLFTIDGDAAFDDICTQLARGDLAAVIPGSEPGVSLADRIARHFGLSGNNPRTTSRRRDKFLMHERLSACGLRAIRQSRLDDPQEIAPWMAASGVHFPVVVKPLQSGGTEGVTLCKTIEEARSAAFAILGRSTILGEINEVFLVQEFLHGPEYVVDAISAEGRCKATNICRYGKTQLNNSAFVYLEAEFFPPSREFSELLDYNEQVLAALGVEYGASHSEIIMTADGPCLVEMGARLAGGGYASIVERISSHAPISMLLDAWTAPDAFCTAAEEPVIFHENAILACLTNTRKGVVAALDADHLIETLPSFVWKKMLTQAGAFIDPTTSLIDCPGLVLLANADKARLYEDRNQFREWDRDARLLHVASPAYKQSRYGV
ncbi:MAG: ATP-grasp domain-containing protein [Pseudomonadota bacterium]